MTSCKFLRDRRKIVRTFLLVCCLGLFVWILAPLATPLGFYGWGFWLINIGACILGVGVFFGILTLCIAMVDKLKD